MNQIHTALNVNDFSTNYPTNIILEKNVWKQVCLTITKYENVQILSHNSSHLYEIESNIESLNKSQDYNEFKLHLGCPTGHFLGAFADIKIYKRNITQEDLQSIRSCQATTSEEIYRTIESHPIDRSFVIKRSISQSELCDKETPKNYVVISHLCGDYFSHQLYCSRLGGRLPSLSKDNIEEVTEVYYKYMDYDSEDKSMIWLETENRKNCNALQLYFQGLNEYSNENYSLSCVEVLIISICVIPANLTVTFIKGRDRSAVLTPLYVRNTVIFVSEKNEILYYQTFPKSHSTRSILYYMTSTAEIMKCDLRIEAKELYIGRRFWKHFDSKFSTNTFLATTTMCGKSSFTCDSGECIQLALRCDGISNCGDQSDEDECSKLMPLQPAYSKDLCPDETLSPVVSFIAKDAGIAEIILNKYQLKLRLTLTLQWIEHRVNFCGIYSGNNFYFPMHNFSNLWKPEIVVRNGIYEDNRNLLHRSSIIEAAYLTTDVEGALSYSDSREGTNFSLNSVLFRHKYLLLFVYISCIYI